MITMEGVDKTRTKRHPVGMHRSIENESIPISPRIL